MLPNLAKAAWASLALLALAPKLSAQAITYLMADRLCITKHDYQTTKGTDTDFYEFHTFLPQPQGAKLIMRVPKLENTFVAKLNNLEPNAKIINCGNLEALDADLVDAVNASTRTLYLIEKNTDGTFFAYQVDEINRLTETPTSLQYQDKRCSFSYRYDTTYAPNANLSRFKNKVSYNNIQKQNCQFVRQFRVMSLTNGDPATVLSFTEGIGITKIAHGNSEIELKTVNGTLLQNHAVMLCNAKDKNITQKVPNTPTKTDPTPPKNSNGASPSLFGGGPKIAIDTNKVIQNPTIPNDRFATRSLGTSKTTSKTPTPPKEVPPGYYVVVEKDNLYKIAQAHGVTVNHLKYWNKLTSDDLKINQLLKVVDDGSDPYLGSNPTYRDDLNQHIRYTIHTVEHNDMLGSIAKRYNTNLKQLYALNNLESDQLQIGQQIIVATEVLP